MGPLLGFESCISLVEDDFAILVFSAEAFASRSCLFIYWRLSTEVQNKR